MTKKRYITPITIVVEAAFPQILSASSYQGDIEVDVEVGDEDSGYASEDYDVLGKGAGDDWDELW